ncbi:MAG: response regulator transcription factor [Actinomycetota bacterium]
MGYIEDHESTALGLRVIVEQAPDLEWVGTAPSVAQLLALSTDFDVVVLDLSLPDDSTPESNVARLEALGIPTLVYTAGERPDLLRSAARAGVFGTIKKKAPPAAVLDAIRRVAERKEVVDAQWAAALDGDPDLRLALLAPREQDVLTMIGSGMSDKMISSRLGIDAETVKTYVGRIRRKYAEIGRNADNRALLGRRAVEDGYVSPDYGRHRR